MDELIKLLAWALLGVVALYSAINMACGVYFMWKERFIDRLHIKLKGRDNGKD